MRALTTTYDLDTVKVAQLLYHESVPAECECIFEALMKHWKKVPVEQRSTNVIRDLLLHWQEQLNYSDVFDKLNNALIKWKQGRVAGTPEDVLCKRYSKEVEKITNLMVVDRLLSESNGLFPKLETYCFYIHKFVDSLNYHMGKRSSDDNSEAGTIDDNSETNEINEPER